MEHIYPAFERGRIMKKELLWALRDYSYSALQLQYQEYSDGIISGCKVKVENNYLIIGKGIIKCQDYIFLINKEEQVKYTPTDVFVSLKFRVISKEELPDYTRYVTEFVLDENLERKQNEIELCRFKLKEGARLRTEYKDFYDIQTEFDTVNLADATWAGIGRSTLSKEVTDYFAKEVLECKDAPLEDVQFAYLLLQSEGAVSCEVIADYVCRKKKDKKSKYTQSLESVFCELEEILGIIRQERITYIGEKCDRNERMLILE